MGEYLAGERPLEKLRLGGLLPLDLERLNGDRLKGLGEYLPRDRDRLNGDLRNGLLE